MPNKNLLAAVDLGSNSFRLLIGRMAETPRGTQIYTVDALKESVRLASGLDADKYLDIHAQRRAIETLQRFAERLRVFAPEQVRVVATNTFRVAKNVREFVQAAEAALGFQIEIIAGREEARLIYIGVAHSLPLLADPDAQRLVVDIGGGSTEFIIGSNYEPRLTESLLMGCVSFTLKFFPNGELNRENLKQAELAARKELETIADTYLASGWHEAMGSSGTAKSLAEILELNHLNPDDAPGITRKGLEKLRDILLRAGHISKVKLAGLKDDRLPVLPGGFAIMAALFDELNIQHMHYAAGALRLGVLYDLLGREQAHDMRELTVAQFMQRYAVDRQHAQAVAQVAGQISQNLPGVTGSDQQLLQWAALLHEVGLSIAHPSYHKHSAYILAHADMPGFSKPDQQRLAALVLGHTGKLAKLVRGDVPAQDWLLVLCLRLAFLFCRRRGTLELPKIEFKPRDPHERSQQKGQQKGDDYAATYQLRIAQNFLQSHPLTDFNLRQEADEWAKLGIRLELPEA